jgi:hypothetical protein
MSAGEGKSATAPGDDGDLNQEYLDALQRQVDAQKPEGFKLTPLPQPDIKEP